MRTFTFLGPLSAYVIILLVTSFSLSLKAQLPPVISNIPDQEIAEGGSFAQIDLNEMVEDQDNTDDQLTWDHSESVYTINIENNIATVLTPDADWYGSDVVTFSVTDPDFNTSSDDALFTVVNENDAPVLLDIPGQIINEGETFASFNLDQYVDDIDDPDDALDWIASENDNLLASIDGAHNVTIETLSDGWTGTQSITFTVQDPLGLEDTDAAGFVINNVNTVPDVADDDYSVEEGASTSIPAPGVLSNDSDADGDPMSATPVSNPDFAAVFDLNADGGFTYTHNGSETTSDGFTYVAGDGTGQSAVANVNITIIPVNDLPVIAGLEDQTIDEGGTFDQIDLNNFVSDAEDDDDLLTWDTDGNTDLVVDINKNTHVARISPPNNSWSGSETITFTVTDTEQGSDSEAATFNVTGMAEVPVAINDSYEVNEGGTLELPAPGVLSNDSDADGDEIFATPVSSPDFASVFDLNTDGSFTYTHDGSENTSDGFTYVAEDGTGQSAVATVSITILPVNDLPVINAIDDQTINEGGTFDPIDLDNFVSDAEDNDDLLAWEATGNTELEVVINENTHIARISPPNNGWSGSETITFTVTDTEQGSDSEAATFNVTGLAEAPVAVDDEYNVNENETLTVDAPGVLVNDTDGDLDPLTAEKLTDPVHGNLTFNPDGSFTYDHDGTENTSDSFTYQASDGTSTSNTATVTITIAPQNEAPVVSDIPNQTVDEGNTFITIVLDNFVEDPDNPDNQITWTSSGSSQLTVSIVNRIATISIPNINWNGAETITFIASDPDDASDSDDAVFTVTSINDAPVVSDIPNQTVDEGSNFTTIVLDNFVNDPDHADNQITWTSSGSAQLTVSIVNRIATITIPNADWNGTETITFTATDPGNESDNDAAIFTVINQTDPPVITDIPNQTITEGNTFTTIVLDTYVSDPDDPDNQIVWTSTGATQLTVNITDRIATVSIPNADWYGSETITFVATDPADASDSDNATFTVTNQNDPPVVSDIPNQMIAEGATFATIPLDNYVTDPDHADNQITWTFNGNSQLNVSIVNRIATISAPNPDWNGNESITFTATDPSSGAGSDVATFVVTPVNDSPEISDIPGQTVLEGGLFSTIALDNYVTDPDHADNQIAWTSSGASQLTVSIINRIATITIPSEDWNGTETITFIATDPENLTDSDAATFMVSPFNDPPVASNLLITSPNNNIGTLYSANFTYSDPDGDAPGVHVYQWYQSDLANGSSATAIPGATAANYKTTKADGGKYVGFEVTPKDVAGAVGTLVRISTFSYVNAAPVATNAMITAPITTPGADITGSFGYTDKESNPPGTHIYHWYSYTISPPVNPPAPGTPIGTSASVYRLLGSDADKYIRFYVTPVASTGSTPGDSIWSNIIGPIGKYTANITGSGASCQGAIIPITLTITGGKGPYSAQLHRTGVLPGDTLITDIETSTRIINVKIPGTYTLEEVIDEGGDLADVSGAQPVVLTITQKSKAVLSGTTSICKDAGPHVAISLNFTSGTAPWTVTLRRTPSNDTTITNITEDPYTVMAPILGNGPTIYRIVSITDVTGCAGDITESGEAVLEYRTSPIATIAGTGSICPGQPTNLTVTLASPGTPPWSFTYMRDGVIIQTINVPTNYTYILQVSQPGVYTLSEVTDPSGTGCGSGQASIIALTPPTATISGNATICEHTTADLSVALTGTAPWKFSYTRNLSDSTSVENVIASPRTVPVKKAGTYRLYEVIDKNACKGSVSGSAVITITPAPEVTLSGLKPAYNFASTEIDTIIGTPAGGTSSGPGVFGFFFIPQLAPLGTHNIVYTYRASPASCYGYDTAVVSILLSNSVINFEDDRTKYCTNDAPFTVTGVNLEGSIGFFTVTGGKGLTDHNNNTATVYPDSLLPNRYTITYTYYQGTEPFPKSADFEIGLPPIANFNWASECFHEGQPIDFVNSSVPTFGFFTDTSYSWRISTNTGYDSDSLRNITYTFPRTGLYNIELKVVNSNSCSDTVTKTLNMRPSIVLQTAYYEDFESNPLSWQSDHKDFPANSWKLGKPSKHGSPLHGFSGPYTDSTSWYTQINSYPAPQEKSWVTSPCFDFTGIDKPMLTMYIWRLFNSNRDGANIQSTADGGKTWDLVGEIGDGENWFNTSYIRGEPGDKDNGWSNNDGVSNDAGWVRARHALDYLKGKKDVQFRIAYGSDGTTQNNDGIAFDDFSIRERSKMAFIEHFTNSSSGPSLKADSTLDAFTEVYGTNVIDIQYHTSNPDGDPFYESNPMIPTSRQFYYGLSAVPYAVIDGGVDSKHHIDFIKTSRPLDKNTIIIQSLKDSKFDVRVESEMSANTLTAQVRIKANVNIPLIELSVRIAVIENVIDGVTGENNDTLFRNVVKAMLPDAAGTTLYRSWDMAADIPIDVSWEIENVYNRDQLRVVAFVQNEATREVYNADLDTVILSTPVDDIPVTGIDGKIDFLIYPNPAQRVAMVKFSESTQDDIFLELFNHLGRMIYSIQIPPGTSEAEIPVEDYSDGLYLLRLTTKQQLIGIGKLVILK